jgi:hypothetical protein
MMKRLLLVPGLMTLLAACGTASTVEDETTEAPELNVTRSALYVCGDGCPAGFALSNYHCAGTACAVGSCTDPNLRSGSTCQDIPDGNDLEPADWYADRGPTAFYACGTVFNPTPYHYPSAHEVNSGCTPNLYTWDSTHANRTRYDVYPGPDLSYTACVRESCRSGEYVLSYSYSSQCRLSTSDSSNVKNATTCKKVVNTSADVCGIVSCPSSKHYVHAYGYRSSCNTTNDGSTERNSTTCVYPSGNPLSLSACGSSCPDGFVAQSYGYSPNCRPSNSSPTSGNNQVYCVKSSS